MADYHGDIGTFDGNFYRSKSDKNLFVAMILLVLLGFTGIHRFYLGHTRLAMTHLFLCFVAVMFGIFTFNFWLALWIFLFQGLWLLVELGLLAFQAIQEM